MKPMRISFRRALSSAVGALLGLLPRVEAATFAEEVTRLATPLVDASGLTPTRSVGMVVMAVTGAGTRTFGFGARSAGGSMPPDGDTFFQVGQQIFGGLHTRIGHQQGGLEFFVECIINLGTGEHRGDAHARAAQTLA
jgi:hypothetical protein